MQVIEPPLKTLESPGTEVIKAFEDEVDDPLEVRLLVIEKTGERAALPHCFLPERVKVGDFAILEPAARQIGRVDGTLSGLGIDNLNQLDRHTVFGCESIVALVALKELNDFLERYALFTARQEETL